MVEVWKDHPVYTAYQVSNKGRVRRKRNRMVKTPRLHPDGYPLVSIYHEKRSRPVLIHRLVWETFEGPLEPYQRIVHVNGDRRDCRLTNLKTATQAAINEKARRDRREREDAIFAEAEAEWA